MNILEGTSELSYYWVIPEKVCTPPPPYRGNFSCLVGENVLLIIVKFTRMSKGGRDVNFQFARWERSGCCLE